MEASRRTAAVSSTARVARDPDLARRGPEAYVAELIGTFMLVFFVGMIVTVHSQGVLGVTDWAVIGLVHFLLLAMLIHTLGGASGGHFNPAVTATLLALRKIGPLDAAIYVVLQIVGAIVGALLVKLLLNDEGDPTGYGAPTMRNGGLISGNSSVSRRSSESTPNTAAAGRESGHSALSATAVNPPTLNVKPVTTASTKPAASRRAVVWRPLASRGPAGHGFAKQAPSISAIVPAPNSSPRTNWLRSRRHM